MKHVPLVSIKIVLLLCTLFLVSFSVDEATTFAEVKGSAYAVIDKIGDINVVKLHGSYRQMGRQYGYLLKDELQEFYSIAIEEYLIKGKGIPLEFLKQGTQADFMLYPERFKNILYGMAETSGMELYKLILLDEIVVLGAVFGPYNACSGVAVWGDYTDNKSLVFGRNFDYFEDFKKFNKFMTVAVYNPDDGSIPTATFGYTGQIQTVNGMNREGIFLEINAGTISGGSIPYPGRVPTLIMFFSFLSDSATMAQLDAIINTSQPGIAYIVNVADKEKAYSYEWPTFGLKKREGEKEGLLVATNHFVHPEWGIPPQPEDDDYKDSVIRRNNLLRLAEEYKGQFNEQKMMEILDIKIEDGGVTKSDTIFQIVAFPPKRILWIKIPGQQNWTSVDLNNLFMKR